jgi:hypothetical protein
LLPKFVDRLIKSDERLLGVFRLKTAQAES